MRLMPRAAAVAVTAAVLLSARPTAAADLRLSAGEIAILTAAPVASLALGRGLAGASREAPPSWVDPPALDRWVATRLAPTPRPGRANFMDSGLASELNTAAMGAAVAWLDLRYPRGDRARGTVDGQLLYWSGLLTLKGVQAGAKAAVGRQRPLPRLWPEIAAARPEIDPGHDREAFWSGHASGAFYGATFLNLRLRGTLRRELAPGDYRSWRWAPPTLLYGWAAWVAYSRIHAHQHYLTDVLAGAAIGAAAAAVFHALDPRERRDGDPAPAAAPIPLAVIDLRF